MRAGRPRHRTRPGHRPSSPPLEVAEALPLPYGKQSPVRPRTYRCAWTGLPGARPGGGGKSRAGHLTRPKAQCCSVRAFNNRPRTRSARLSGIAPRPGGVGAGPAGGCRAGRRAGRRIRCRASSDPGATTVTVKVTSLACPGAGWGVLGSAAGAGRSGAAGASMVRFDFPQAPAKMVSQLDRRRPRRATCIRWRAADSERPGPFGQQAKSEPCPKPTWHPHASTSPRVRLCVVDDWASLPGRQRAVARSGHRLRHADVVAASATTRDFGARCAAACDGPFGQMWGLGSPSAVLHDREATTTEAPCCSSHCSPWLGGGALAQLRRRKVADLARPARPRKA